VDFYGVVDGYVVVGWGVGHVGKMYMVALLGSVLLSLALFSISDIAVDLAE